MRVGLVLVESCLACCLVACGPSRSVERGYVVGTGGAGGATSSARSGGRGGSGGLAGAPGLGSGGADGVGGSYTPPDAAGGNAGAAGGSGGAGGASGIQPGTGGSGTGGTGGTGGGSGDAGPTAEVTPPVDAAAPDAAAPAPPDAAPVQDAAPDLPAGVPPPTTVCPAAPAAGEVIATFLQGMLVNDPVEGRGGTSWSVLSGTVNAAEGIAGMLAPGAGPANCGSADFMRFTGTTNQVRAPIIRANFRNNAGSAAQFTDASAWKGIRLWLRSATGGRVRVKIPDRNTSTPGRICTLCNDHFALEMDVSADWQLFTVPFAAMKQLGTGDPQPALATNVILALEIVAPKTAQFTLDIDDISFLR